MSKISRVTDLGAGLISDEATVAIPLLHRSLREVNRAAAQAVLQCLSFGAEKESAAPGDTDSQLRGSIVASGSSGSEFQVGNMCGTAREEESWSLFLRTYTFRDQTDGTLSIERALSENPRAGHDSRVGMHFVSTCDAYMLELGKALTPYSLSASPRIVE